MHCAYKRVAELNAHTVVQGWLHRLLITKLPLTQTYTAGLLHFLGVSTVAST